MMSVPVPDTAVAKAREATQALIDASKVVLNDLWRNQHSLEQLLDRIEEQEIP